MHPSLEAMLKNFDYGHLPPNLADVSKPLCKIAHNLAANESLHGSEFTAGLRKLLEAKDCFVRAALAGHGSQS